MTGFGGFEGNYTTARFFGRTMERFYTRSILRGIGLNVDEVGRASRVFFPYDNLSKKKMMKTGLFGSRAT